MTKIGKLKYEPETRVLSLVQPQGANKNASIIETVEKDFKDVELYYQNLVYYFND
jgi:hypothetical protein